MKKYWKVILLFRDGQWGVHVPVNQKKRYITPIIPEVSGNKSYERNVCVLVAQSCPTFCDPWTGSHQAPLSMGFIRQEYWSGLPFPPPGDLPNPGIEPVSPASLAL